MSFSFVLFPLALFAAVTMLTWLATRRVLALLIARQIMDTPNARSSHDVPTPRGGGLALAPVLVLAWSAIGLYTGALTWIAPALVGALALAALSWLDDVRDLSAALRLGVHLFVSGLAVALLPGEPILQGLVPGWLDAVLATLLLTWFINLFNFMDGIDGITGVEVMAIGLGVFGLAFLTPFLPVALLGLAAAGVGLGFLFLNWHPAKLFMGDVGSVPIGFLLGWLLLVLAGKGLWAPALILPLYYLADATITISRRALRGEKIWQAHRQHFYQRAVHVAGLTHDAVVRRIAVADALLIGLALAAVKCPWTMTGLAFVVVAGLLFALQTARPADEAKKRS